MQALKSQYTEKEGYVIRKPKIFLFEDPGDGLEPYLSITMDEYKGCFVAANPQNKQVNSYSVQCNILKWYNNYITACSINFYHTDCVLL